MDFGLNLSPEPLGETRVLYVPPFCEGVLEVGFEEFDPRKHNTKVVLMRPLEVVIGEGCGECTIKEGDAE